MLSGLFVPLGSGGSRIRVGTTRHGHPTCKWTQVRPQSTQDPEPLSPLNSQGRYDEEIEVYRHHLEQMYKLCRPCQAAVEHYIKHQNRQLRALLLSHQFKRREVDQSHTQVSAGRPRGIWGVAALELVQETLA